MLLPSTKLASLSHSDSRLLFSPLVMIAAATANRKEGMYNIKASVDAFGRCCAIDVVSGCPSLEPLIASDNSFSGKIDQIGFLNMWAVSFSITILEQSMSGEKPTSRLLVC